MVNIMHIVKDLGHVTIVANKVIQDIFSTNCMVDLTTTIDIIPPRTPQKLVVNKFGKSKKQLQVTYLSYLYEFHLKKIGILTMDAPDI